MYADIVLPLAVPGAYTYRLPASLEARITIGSRVVVPLGKNKRYTGIVIRLREDAPATKIVSKPSRNSSTNAPFCSNRRSNFGAGWRNIICAFPAK